MNSYLSQINLKHVSVLKQYVIKGEREEDRSTYVISGTL